MTNGGIFDPERTKELDIVAYMRNAVSAARFVAEQMRRLANNKEQYGPEIKNGFTRVSQKR